MKRMVWVVMAGGRKGLDAETMKVFSSEKAAKRYNDRLLSDGNWMYTIINGQRFQ